MLERLEDAVLMQRIMSVHVYTKWNAFLGIFRTRLLSRNDNRGGQVKTRYNQEGTPSPPRTSKLALASPESVVEKQLLDIAALEDGRGEYIIAR
jgi:hypothetical protein